MTKSEFLVELKQRLRKLPLEEQEQALVYYEEYFNEAGAENEARVLEELKSPAAVAAKIIGEYAVHTSVDPKKKSSIGLVGLLAACAAPIALPLAVSAIAVMIALVAVFFSLGIAATALVAAGAVSIVTAACTTIGNFSTGMFYLGYGLVLCAIGIPSAKGIWRLSQTAWQSLTAKLGKALMHKGGN